MPLSGMYGREYMVRINVRINKRKINRAYLYVDILIAKNPMGKKANKLVLLI